MMQPTLPLKVSIVRPLGRGGRGGIDRIVDNEFATIDPNVVEIKETVTRGKGAIIFSPLYLGWGLVGLVWRRLMGQVDLVHINLSSHGSVFRKRFVFLLCQALGLPYTIHLHGSRFRQFWDGLPAKQSATLAIHFENAARVFVLGQVWKEYVQAKSPRSRIEILLNGTFPPTPVRENQLNTDSIHILFLGFIGSRKGTPELVRALEHLNGRQLPDWHATLAGNGEVEKCRNHIDKSGLTDRIALPGWVDSAGVATLLQSADILVLPSHDENLPMSVIEGMAYGLAVVTTPVGATESLIQDEKTGLLVPPGDVSKLADGLGRLISDPPFRAKLGAAAQIFHAQHLDIYIHSKNLTAAWQAIRKERLL